MELDDESKLDSIVQIPTLVINKQDREYVPYDVAKHHMHKLVVQLNDQRGKYVVTIRALEDKYKKIEIEANGHFSAFVTQIKSQVIERFYSNSLQ